MILGFNPQFVAPILHDTKIHSLRLDPHNRWKEGRTIHFATGVRSKKYNCFKNGKCFNTQSVVMFFDEYGYLIIQVDGRVLNLEEIHLFVKNDGFASVLHFISWFWPKDKMAILFLKLINWSDFKY